MRYIVLSEIISLGKVNLVEEISLKSVESVVHVILIKWSDKVSNFKKFVKKSKEGNMQFVSRIIVPVNNRQVRHILVLSNLYYFCIFIFYFSMFFISLMNE